MDTTYQIRLGGYGPPTTSFSRSLKRIGDRMEEQFGDDVDIKYIYNIMDLGYKGEDILWLTEHGLLTISYQSSSYLTDRVPELGFVDLPFLFENNEQARAAIDGALGQYLSQKTEERINYKILGYFENGFRQISNKLRPVRRPADFDGMSIRVLPSDVQARTFELLGATPKRMDLTEAIEGIVDGSLDAQENPFANTVTYGAHKYHHYHTLSNHFYISRSIMCHRATYSSWPEELQSAMQEAVRDAIVWQRGQAEQEAVDSRKAIEDAGCEIVELTPEEHAEFVQAVKPQHDDAREVFGDKMFELMEQT
ncbi:MAG: TRAP transporter substrate-binding protein [Rhodospirillaceae bacterium]|nr:TRAP transporter substrate-binding protein [Rhodospirillaceae bacterium]